jgi:transcriptional regulator of acetoin/glycerol metabolism
VRPELRTREELLRSAVDDALWQTNGGLSQAARRRRMAHGTLYRILHRR